MFSRESLFLLTYLLFLINTVVGLIVAIWRMVITALFNIVHLGRVDISLLHRTAESYDPGSTSSRFDRQFVLQQLNRANKSQSYIRHDL